MLIIIILLLTLLINKKNNIFFLLKFIFLHFVLILYAFFVAVFASFFLFWSNWKFFRQNKLNPFLIDFFYKDKTLYFVFWRYLIIYIICFINLILNLLKNYIFELLKPFVVHIVVFLEYLINFYYKYIYVYISKILIFLMYHAFFIMNVNNVIYSWLFKFNYNILNIVQYMQDPIYQRNYNLILNYNLYNYYINNYMYKFIFSFNIFFLMSKKYLYKLYLYLYINLNLYVKIKKSLSFIFLLFNNKNYSFMRFVKLKILFKTFLNFIYYINIIVINIFFLFIIFLSSSFYYFINFIIKTKKIWIYILLFFILINAYWILYYYTYMLFQHYFLHFPILNNVKESNRFFNFEYIDLRNYFTLILYHNTLVDVSSFNNNVYNDLLNNLNKTLLLYGFKVDTNYNIQLYSLLNKLNKDTQFLYNFFKNENSIHFFNAFLNLHHKSKKQMDKLEAIDKFNEESEKLYTALYTFERRKNWLYSYIINSNMGAYLNRLVLNNNLKELLEKYKDLLKINTLNITDEQLAQFVIEAKVLNNNLLNNVITESEWRSQMNTIFKKYKLKKDSICNISTDFNIKKSPLTRFMKSVINKKKKMHQSFIDTYDMQVKMIKILTASLYRNSYGSNIYRFLSRQKYKKIKQVHLNWFNQFYVKRIGAESNTMLYTLGDKMRTERGPEYKKWNKKVKKRYLLLNTDIKFIDEILKKYKNKGLRRQYLIKNLKFLQFYKYKIPSLLSIRKKLLSRKSNKQKFKIFINYLIYKVYKKKLNWLIFKNKHLKIYKKKMKKWAKLNKLFKKIKRGKSRNVYVNINQLKYPLRIFRFKPYDKGLKHNELFLKHNFKLFKKYYLLKKHSSPYYNRRIIAHWVKPHAKYRKEIENWGGEDNRNYMRLYCRWMHQWLNFTNNEINKILIYKPPLKIKAKFDVHTHAKALITKYKMLDDINQLIFNMSNINLYKEQPLEPEDEWFLRSFFSPKNDYENGNEDELNYLYDNFVKLRKHINFYDLHGLYKDDILRPRLHNNTINLNKYNFWFFFDYLQTEKYRKSVNDYNWHTVLIRKNDGDYKKLRHWLLKLANLLCKKNFYKKRFKKLSLVKSKMVSELLYFGGRLQKYKKIIKKIIVTEFRDIVKKKRWKKFRRRRRKFFNAKLSKKLLAPGFFKRNHKHKYRRLYRNLFLLLKSFKNKFYPYYVYCDSTINSYNNSYSIKVKTINRNVLQKINNLKKQFYLQNKRLNGWSIFKYINSFSLDFHFKKLFWHSPYSFLLFNVNGYDVKKLRLKKKKQNNYMLMFNFFYNINIINYNVSYIFATKIILDKLFTDYYQKNNIMYLDYYRFFIYFLFEYYNNFLYRLMRYRYLLDYKNYTFSKFLTNWYNFYIPSYIRTLPMILVPNNEFPFYSRPYDYHNKFIKYWTKYGGPQFVLDFLNFLKKILIKFFPLYESCIRDSNNYRLKERSQLIPFWFFYDYYIKLFVFFLLKKYYVKKTFIYYWFYKFLNFSYSIYFTIFYYKIKYMISTKITLLFSSYYFVNYKYTISKNKLYIFLMASSTIIIKNIYEKTYMYINNSWLLLVIWYILTIVFKIFFKTFYNIIRFSKIFWHLFGAAIIYSIIKIILFFKIHFFLFKICDLIEWIMVKLIKIFWQIKRSWSWLYTLILQKDKIKSYNLVWIQFHLLNLNQIYLYNINKLLYMIINVHKLFKYKFLSFFDINNILHFYKPHYVYYSKSRSKNTVKNSKSKVSLLNIFKYSNVFSLKKIYSNLNFFNNIYINNNSFCNLLKKQYNFNLYGAYFFSIYKFNYIYWIFFAYIFIYIFLFIFLYFYNKSIYNIYIFCNRVKEPHDSWASYDSNVIKMSNEYMKKKNKIYKYIYKKNIDFYKFYFSTQSFVNNSLSNLIYKIFINTTSNKWLLNFNILDSVIYENIKYKSAFILFNNNFNFFGKFWKMPFKIKSEKYTYDYHWFNFFNINFFNFSFFYWIILIPYFFMHYLLVQYNILGDKNKIKIKLFLLLIIWLEKFKWFIKLQRLYNTFNYKFIHHPEELSDKGVPFLVNNNPWATKHYVNELFYYYKRKYFDSKNQRENETHLLYAKEPGKKREMYWKHALLNKKFDLFVMDKRTELNERIKRLVGSERANLTEKKDAKYKKGLKTLNYAELFGNKKKAPKIYSKKSKNRYLNPPMNYDDFVDVLQKNNVSNSKEIVNNIEVNRLKERSKMNKFLKTHTNLIKTRYIERELPKIQKWKRTRYRHSLTTMRVKLSGLGCYYYWFSRINRKEYFYNYINYFFNSSLKSVYYIYIYIYIVVLVFCIKKLKRWVI